MILNYAINKLISLDPSLIRHLQPLQHKCLELIFSDLASKRFFFVFDTTNVQIYDKQSRDIDVSIAVSVTGKIKIEGDALLAQAIHELYKNLDIDWEEHLSHYTGDVIAHQLAFRIKRFKNYQQQNKQSLEQMVTEYLQEESGLLPTNYELDKFMQEVDDLRLRADRLEARIKMHEST